VIELVAVGAQAEEVAAGALAAGMPASAVHVRASAADAVPLVRRLVQPGDVVLVKGSRGERMEQIVRY
jgi:UDP-N-acetylmuramoyl-tripeptide--D-alanyl-D-alanine ligase